MEDYFYGLPVADKGAYAVDVGCDSVITLNIDKDDELNTFTRTTISKKHDISYTIYEPCLPLDKPNTYMTMSTSDFISKKFYKETDLRIMSKVSKHYNEFKLVHEKDFRRTVNLCLHGYQLERFETSYKKAVKFQDITYRKFLPTGLNVYRCNTNLKLHDILGDIPQEVLKENIDTCLFQDYDDFHNNYSHCNTTCSFLHNSHVYVACPFGLCLSGLAIKELTSQNADSNVSLSSRNVVTHEFGFQIREITKIVGFFIFVRGDYHCAVCSIDFKNDLVGLSVTFQWSFDELLQCACINQYNLQEVVVSTVKRQLSVLHGSTNQRLVADNPFAEEVDWQRCIYGTSLQTCLVSTEADVVLYDFRLPATQSVQYLELPCQYMNRVEKFSPVLLWSPTNLHQYIVTTDQSFILNDERYLKTPILKVNHYMEAPPRYLETYDLGCDNFLITLGSYNSRETMCMQLCKHNDCQPSVRDPPWKFSSFDCWENYLTDWRSSLSVLKDRLNQPLSGFTLFDLPEIDSKHQHLCGVISQSLPGDLFYQIFSHKHSENQSSRLNKSFVSTKHLTCPDLKPLQLCEPYRGKCEYWLQDILDFDINLLLKEHRDKCRNSSSLTMPSSINMNKTEEKNSDPNPRRTEHTKHDRRYEKVIEDTASSSFTEQPKSYLSLPVDNIQRLMHSSFSLSDDEVNEANEKKDDYIIENVVLEGGIEDKSLEEHNKKVQSDNDKLEIGLYEKISSLKEQNVVLSNKSLNRKCSLNSLCSFKDTEQFKGPISKVLHKNWESDEYIFFDTFAPNVAFDPSFNTN